MATVKRPSDDEDRERRTPEEVAEQIRSEQAGNVRSDEEGQEAAQKKTRGQHQSE